MRGGVVVGYLVPLAALCAAVAALSTRPTTDATSKKPPPVKGTPPAAPAPTTAPAPAPSAPTATAAATRSTADHHATASTHHDAAATTKLTAAATSVSPTTSTATPASTRTASTAASAEKRRTRPTHHRTTRRGSVGVSLPGTVSVNLPGAGGEGEASRVPADGEANLTDAAVLKSAPTAGRPSVRQGAYPFVATVQKVCGGCHTRHYCAAAVLSPLWVLSLPQCAETHPGEALVVRAGDSFIWPGDHTATQKVIEVVWHEASSSTDEYPRYDAILMRLENPFQFGDNLNAINLAPPSHNVEGSVLVLGWSPPGQAQQVELNVTHAAVRPSSEECARIAPQESLPADTACAQPAEPLLDHCAYDLGDPVIVDTEPPQLVGLLSRWYHPCSPEHPIVLLKASALYAWIYEKVNPAPVTGRPPHSTEPSGGTAATATVTTTPTTVSTNTPVPAPAPSTAATAAATHHPATTASDTSPSTPAPPLAPHAVHIRPMTVSSSSASGALSNTTSTSDAALLAGHMESSLSYSLGTAGVEPGKPALSNSVSVGWANCRDVGGALGMSYALSYSFIGEGAASSASTVNATCLEMNAVQSQGWSISTSGGSAPLNVRAFIMEHLASIPGLPRQPTLRYL